MDPTVSRIRSRPSRVALFITCLVDLVRPEVGEATVALLERLGLEVVFPADQTCCGAPAHHAGWAKEAESLARRWIEIFEPYEAVVAPSATCVALARLDYPRLLAGDPSWRARAQALGARTYELSEFLVDVMGVQDVGATFEGTIAYHAACHLLRLLGIDRQPRALLAHVKGATLVPLADPDTCCGFGGPFSVDMPRLSIAIGERKARVIEEAGADVLVTCETGCLLQLDGILASLARTRRRESEWRVLHLAELLAPGRMAQ